MRFDLVTLVSAALLFIPTQSAIAQAPFGITKGLSLQDLNALVEEALRRSWIAVSQQGFNVMRGGQND